jgi:hypothetical protein
MFLFLKILIYFGTIKKKKISYLLFGDGESMLTVREKRSDLKSFIQNYHLLDGRIWKSRVLEIWGLIMLLLI